VEAHAGLFPAAAMSAAGAAYVNPVVIGGAADSQHRQLIEGVIRLLRSVGR
jgi:hypothetical protein